MNRPPTPEQKAAWEDEKQRLLAEQFHRKYRFATERIPKSKWILMGRESKAEVFAAREQLAFEFNQLSARARELAVQVYGVDAEVVRSTSDLQ